MTWREIRCACHRLLAKASSTSAGKVEVQCPRCKLRTHYQWSTGS